MFVLEQRFLGKGFIKNDLHVFGLWITQIKIKKWIILS